VGQRPVGPLKEQPPQEEGHHTTHARRDSHSEQTAAKLRRSLNGTLVEERKEAPDGACKYPVLSSPCGVGPQGAGFAFPLGHLEPSPSPNS
jgi:hypothetical protein